MWNRVSDNWSPFGYDRNGSDYKEDFVKDGYMEEEQDEGVIDYEDNDEEEDR